MRPIKRAITAGVAVLTILLWTACSGNSSAHTNRQVTQHDNRKLAPDFTLTDANGNSVKLSDYRGKVVLLNFWATWCGPCKIEIPWLMQFEKEYKDRGFAVLA